MLRFLDERGYAIVPSILRDDECEDLITRLAAPEVPRSRAGARHLFSIPFVSQVAHDDRLREIASSALHSDAIPFRVTLFDKSADSNWSVVWHQDTALPLRRRFEAPGWGPWSVKGGVHYAHAPASALEQVVALRVHLDESSATNGPLRVLSGSHLPGVLSDDEVVAIAARSVPADCLVTRGGVLAMRPLLVHSSPRVASDAPRRVLHIEYAAPLLISPGVELAAA